MQIWQYISVNFQTNFRNSKYNTNSGNCRSIWSSQMNCPNHVSIPIHSFLICKTPRRLSRTDRKTSTLCRCKSSIIALRLEVREKNFNTLPMQIFHHRPSLGSQRPQEKQVEGHPWARNCSDSAPLRSWAASCQKTTVSPRIPSGKERFPSTVLCLLLPFSESPLPNSFQRKQSWNKKPQPSPNPRDNFFANCNTW